MISVVIPALNAEASLPDTLSALIPATVEGIVREVILVDGGSDDHTREIADAAGADVLVAEPITVADNRAIRPADRGGEVPKQLDVGVGRGFPVLRRVRVDHEAQRARGIDTGRR